MLQNRNVRVEMQDALVLRLLPRHELGACHVLRPLFLPFIVRDGYIQRHQFDVIPIPRLDEQLAVPVGQARDLRVPCFRVDEDAVCLAAKADQGFEKHDGIA